MNGRTGCSYQRWFHWKGIGLLVLGSSQGACHPQIKPDVVTRCAPTKVTSFWKHTEWFHLSFSYRWRNSKYGLRVPGPNRIYALYASMKRGMSTEEIHELFYIDRWFLLQFQELLDIEGFLSITKLSKLSKDYLRISRYHLQLNHLKKKSMPVTYL